LGLGRVIPFLLLGVLIVFGNLGQNVHCAEKDNPFRT